MAELDGFVICQQLTWRAALLRSLQPPPTTTTTTHRPHLSTSIATYFCLHYQYQCYRMGWITSWSTYLSRSTFVACTSTLYGGILHYWQLRNGSIFYRRHLYQSIYLSACSRMIVHDPRSKSEGLMATSIGYPNGGPVYSHIPWTPRRQQNPPRPQPWEFLSAPYPDNPKNSPNFARIRKSRSSGWLLFGR